MPRSILLVAIPALTLSVCSTFWFPKQRLSVAMRFLGGANIVFGLITFIDLSSRGTIFWLPPEIIDCRLLVAGGLRGLHYCS